jgi:hypothetical protein
MTKYMAATGRFLPSLFSQAHGCRKDDKDWSREDCLRMHFPRAYPTHDSPKWRHRANMMAAKRRYHRHAAP